MNETMDYEFIGSLISPKSKKTIETQISKKSADQNDLGVLLQTYSNSNKVEDEDFLESTDISVIEVISKIKNLDEKKETSQTELLLGTNQILLTCMHLNKISKMAHASRKVMKFIEARIHAWLSRLLTALRDLGGHLKPETVSLSLGQSPCITLTWKV
eukprot:TRINITY_DN8234_c0_g1_i1.p1 TRINITY_DN8234_c0_g1~~TRINITY_DN8234_c0_g1_i1.p1  ORF type:complete len:158 (+),score=23.31 TRINITY_DN8234_c0_g1_i1:182-655(+)